MSNDDKNRERKFHLYGWILFLICAGFFIASGVVSDNILGITGSLVFLAGCVVFLIPLVTKGKQDKDS